MEIEIDLVFCLLDDNDLFSMCELIDLVFAWMVEISLVFVCGPKIILVLA